MTSGAGQLESGDDMSDQARVQRAARWAAALFLFGAVAGLFEAVFFATSGREVAMRGVFALCLFGVAALLWRLPNERWRLSYLVGVVPVAFLWIVLHEWLIGFTDYMYPLSFVLVYVWVGLTLPRWAPWAVSPLLVLAFVGPKLDEPEALQSALLAVPTCLVVGEVISMAVHRLRRYRDESIRRAEVFHRVAQAARQIGSLDSHAVGDEIAAAGRQLGFDVACMLRVLPGGEQVEMTAVSGMAEDQRGRVFALDQGIIGAVARQGAAVVWDRDEIDREGCALLQDSDQQVAYAEPVFVADELAAVLTVGRYRGGAISLDERAAVEILALEASVALVNAEHFASEQRRALDYRDQSMKDSLTGLGNRRLLDSLLEVLAPEDVLVLVDLDHFKWVNDTHGHDRGDEVLVTLAGFLQRELREGDVAIRHGGEEFVVVMPRAGAQAEGVARRLLERWRESGPVTTFSMGLATHRAESAPDETLKRADEALYAAKRGGRNRLSLTH